jgi:quercetin dioxygenase-like cupin family protein
MLLSRRHFALLAASQIWTPESIRWQRTDPGGSRYAVLDGDRDDPSGLFTYAFWMPGGLWVKAHAHSQQAHVTVTRGTLQLGFGKVTDRSRTAAIPAGGFFIVRAHEPHFEGCAADTLIIGTARGGWKTTELE